jgi:hypothetical protein
MLKAMYPVWHESYKAYLEKKKMYFNYYTNKVFSHTFCVSVCIYICNTIKYRKKHSPHVVFCSTTNDWSRLRHTRTAVEGYEMYTSRYKDGAFSWTIGFRFLAGQIFSPQRPDRFWCPSSPLSVRYRDSFLGVRQPGREPNHLPLYGAEVKNACSYTTMPHTFAWRDA